MSVAEPWLDSPEGPHGWIQWKGTEVCMDLHCSCGESSHFDGGFAYIVACPRCKQAFKMNGHVTAHPIVPEQGDDVKMAEANVL